MARPASKSTTESDIQQSQLESVQADVVRMQRSAANDVTADQLDLNMSAAADVRASKVEAHQSALGAVRANEVWLSNSAAGAIQADNVVMDGGALAVLAGNADLGTARVGVVAGQNIRGEQIRTVLLIGGHIEGEVHTALDTSQTVLAGLVGGLVVGVLYSLGRMLSRRG